MFFCYCSMELTTSLWASTYLVQKWDFSPEAAAGYASMFYIGVTLGRFINGFLAMKLGEVEMYKQETGETPVLLLDDVLSELDKTRRDILLEATMGVQTILTCTEFDGVGAKLFEVKEGKIVKG